VSWRTWHNFFGHSCVLTFQTTHWIFPSDHYIAAICGTIWKLQLQQNIVLTSGSLTHNQIWLLFFVFWRRKQLLRSRTAVWGRIHLTGVISMLVGHFLLIVFNPLRSKGDYRSPAAIALNARMATYTRRDAIPFWKWHKINTSPGIEVKCVNIYSLTIIFAIFLTLCIYFSFTDWSLTICCSTHWHGVC